MAGGTGTVGTIRQLPPAYVLDLWQLQYHFYSGSVGTVRVYIIRK